MTTPDKDTIQQIAKRTGRAIREYRQLNNMSSEKLAHLLGIKDNQVTDVENGKLRLDINDIVFAFNLLHIPPERLFENLNTDLSRAGRFATEYSKLNSDAMVLLQNFTHSLLLFQNHKFHDVSLAHLQNVIIHEYQMLQRASQTNEEMAFAVSLESNLNKTTVTLDLTEDILDMRIEDILDINKRLRGILSKHYEKVRDLVAAPMEDLVRIHGLGKQSFIEMQEFLKLYGLSLSE